MPSLGSSNLWQHLNCAIEANKSVSGQRQTNKLSTWPQTSFWPSPPLRRPTARANFVKVNKHERRPSALSPRQVPLSQRNKEAAKWQAAGGGERAGGLWTPDYQTNGKRGCLWGAKMSYIMWHVLVGKGEAQVRKDCNRNRCCLHSLPSNLAHGNMAGSLAGEQTVSERSDSERQKQHLNLTKNVRNDGQAAASFLSPSNHAPPHPHHHHYHHHEHHLRHQEQQAAEWIKLKPGQVCWLMICSKYLRTHESLWMGKCSIYVDACVIPFPDKWHMKR